MVNNVTFLIQICAGDFVGSGPPLSYLRNFSEIGFDNSKYIIK